MSNKNISVVNGNIRFNYRVAVLLEYEDKILLETSSGFWNMIGGRVQYGESSLDAVSREVYEELGIQIQNLKLINISENFFKWKGKTQQEMLFVYRANVREDCSLTKTNEFKCLDSDKTFKWFSKEKILELDCRPKIIKELLSQTSSITHNIDKEI